MFAPSKKAGHMVATDQLCETSQKILANWVPSTHGPERALASGIWITSTVRSIYIALIAHIASRLSDGGFGNIVGPNSKYQ